MDNLFQKHIERSISNALNEKITIVSSIPISGGNINQAYCLETAHKKYFIKTHHKKYYGMFCSEVASLQAIAETDCICVPKVICVGEFDQQSFLVLEYLQLTPRGDMALFARKLANLHLKTQPEFGFENHNFIGTTPQKNSWTKSWTDFFSKERISFQLELLKQKNLNRKTVKKFDMLQRKLPEFFKNYQPIPALLHGDLWQGNYAFDVEGKPIVYDPASYYGDHEADLAMLELFGQPGAEFFQRYSQIFPIDSGYFYRKPLYNLYHIMNHANLFGGSYFQQLENRVDDLLEISM